MDRYACLAATCLTLMAVPMLALADDHRPQDWPEGSAMHTGRTAQLRYAVADKRLNDTYQKLLKAMPEDESDHYPRKVVVEAQRAWIRYRDASCAVHGELNGGARMWKSAQNMTCKADATEKRTTELEQLLVDFSG